MRRTLRTVPGRRRASQRTRFSHRSGTASALRAVVNSGNGRGFWQWPIVPTGARSCRIQAFLGRRSACHLGLCRLCRAAQCELRPQRLSAQGCVPQRATHGCLGRPREVERASRPSGGRQRRHRRVTPPRAWMHLRCWSPLHRRNGDSVAAQSQQPPCQRLKLAACRTQ